MEVSKKNGHVTVLCAQFRTMLNYLLTMIIFSNAFQIHELIFNNFETIDKSAVAY